MTPGSRPPASRPPRALVAVVYGGFFVTGVVTVLLGPLIPELAATWQVGYAAAGTLFVAQFTASSLGALVSSFDLRRSLIGGYLAMACGLVLLTAGGWSWAWIAMALVGVGLGLTIPASNLWTAHAFPAHRGAALSLLNLMWGLGAVACPLLFAALLGHAPATAATTALAALATLAALLLLAGRVRGTGAPATAGAASATPVGALVLLAAIFFLYVGVENAIGGWLVAFADRLGSERSTVSLLIGSGFWGALLTGRLVTPWLLRHLTEPRLYTASLGLAAGGTLALALADTRGRIAAAAALAGLGLAAVYPLTVSLLAARTAATGSRATGWVFAFGGLGGAAVPWLTGRVAVATEGPGRGFWVPLAALALLAVLFARLVSWRTGRGAPGGGVARPGGC